jgi:MFS family permease
LERELYGVTAMTLLSYAGEYMAFTSILAWLDLLLLANGYTPIQAFGFGFLVSSAYLLLSGVLAVPLGFLADLFGRKRVATGGCVVAGLSIIAVSFTGGLTGATSVIVSISALLLLIGIGHATYTTSALAYAGDVSTEKDVGEAYGLVETAEYFMFMFGTPLGFALASATSNQTTFYVTGAILMGGAVAALVGMPERRVASALPAGPPQEAAGSASKPSLLKAVSDPQVVLSLLAIFFVSVGFTVFRVYLTQYGSGVARSPLPGPFVVSIMAFAGVLGAFPIGRLVDTTKKRGLFMASGFLVEGVGLALILFEPSAFTLFLWAVVFGVGVMLVRVPQAVVIAERTVFGNRASAMGVNHGVEHVGYGLGAFLGGVLLVYLGFTTLDTFWLVAVVSVAFGLVLLPLAKVFRLP